MTNFPKKLKAYRLERGYTQKELASLMGVSQNAIYNWENGKREPKMETLIKLAKVLKTKVLYLTSDVEEDALGIYITQPDGNEHFFSGEQIADPNIENQVSDYDRPYIIENRKFLSLMTLSQVQPENQLLSAFKLLNGLGRVKAIEQVEMLTKIPEYRADTQPPAAKTPAPSDQEE